MLLLFPVHAQSGTEYYDAKASILLAKRSEAKTTLAAFRSQDLFAGETFGEVKLMTAAPYVDFPGVYEEEDDFEATDFEQLSLDRTSINGQAAERTAATT